MNEMKRNWILFGLAALLAAGAFACGSSDDDRPNDNGAGGGGGVEIPDTGDEDCFNGEDDDGDGLVDCDDPDCSVVPECQGSCTSQMPVCETNQTGRSARVCLDGSCQPAGTVSDDGKLVLGSVSVRATLADNLRIFKDRNRTYLLELVHPMRPDGVRTTCKDLVEDARFGGSLERFNVIAAVTNAIERAEDTTPMPAFDMPVPDEEGWFALVRFWGARTPTGDPAGEVVAIGCMEGMQIPATCDLACVQDETCREERGCNVNLRFVESVCKPGGSECPDPLSCTTALLCRDQRCEDCNRSGVVCRDVDGDAMCLKTCDVAGTQRCPERHRCDTTPGMVPACVPLD